MLMVSSMVADDLFGGTPLEGLTHFASLSMPHPPLGYLPSTLLVKIVPLRWCIALSSTLSVGLLLDALIRIGRPFPSWGSVLVGSIALGSGLCWWSADHYGFDLVGAAAVLQTLSWLEASQYLRRRRESILFGVWLGVTFLTKYTAPLVLFLPTVVLCGWVLFRRPRRVLDALLGWGVVTLPWLLLNAPRVWYYALSSVRPDDNPANHQTAMSLSERLFGGGWELVSAALVDALSWPVVGLALLAALVSRRAALLLAFASGFLLLSVYNNPHGRHVLPLLFVLAAAAIPRLAPGASLYRRVLAWVTVAGLAALGLTSMVGSVQTYGLHGQRLPGVRRFEHTLAGFPSLGSWPEPAEQFLPLSYDLAEWRIPEVNAAIEALSSQPISVLLMPHDAISPGLSVYALFSVSSGGRVRWSEAHARIGSGGEVEIETMMLPEDQTRYVYAVLAPNQQSPAELWFARTPHRAVERLALPHGMIGVIAILDQPYLPEEAWSGNRFRPGEVK